MSHKATRIYRSVTADNIAGDGSSRTRQKFARLRKRFFFLLASEKWGIGKMATPHPPIWVDNAFPHRWIRSSSYTLSSVYWLILCLNRGSSSFSKSFFVRYCYLTYVAEMSVKCAWKIGFSLWQMSKGIEWG